MKHLRISTIVAISTLLVCTAGAQQNRSNRIKHPADQTFVTKAAQGGMAEVEFGRLAKEHGANAKVKQFGQRMIDDHTKANDDLKAVAAKKGFTLPNALDAKDEATKNRLSGLNGAAFDHAYMEDMVKDHEADIAEFQREADHGTDPDVKAFASRTLSTLQEHLQLAKTTLTDVKTNQ